MNKSYFSKEDLAAFERDGFIMVRGMYNGTELQRWVTELSKLPEVPGQAAFYYEDSLMNKGERVLSRIEQFVEYHEELSSLIYGDKMMGRLRELLGEELVLFKEKVNFKLPGGSGFELHQDSQAGWESFSKYFMSVMVSVDENTVENGCLELAAGLHKQGLLGEEWQPMSKEDLQGTELKKYPTEPGDVVFFDSYVPHGSAPNTTDQPRRNIYLTYNRATEGDFRAAYYKEKRKNLPPDIEREPGKVYEYKV